MNTIDLNADLGESFGAYTIGNDHDVLKLVSSANIACGFHAGDPVVMHKTCAQAIEAGVRLGAHPGYRDLAGFGRRTMIYHPDELRAEIIYQIGALQALAQAVGGELSYVKPHGALYNHIAAANGAGHEQADAVIDAIMTVNPNLKLMGLAGSAILEYAQDRGLKVIAEAFADRAYNSDGTLVSRTQPGSVLHDPLAAADQALAFALGEPIKSLQGDAIHVQADSICVHGDNAQAVALIETIRSRLSDNGVNVRAC